MATTILTTVPEIEIREFFKYYDEYMKDELISGYLGVTNIKFKVEMAKNGYKLICETNKAMNQGATSHVRNLTLGFIAGWNAKTQQQMEKITNDLP